VHFTIQVEARDGVGSLPRAKAGAFGDGIKEREAEPGFTATTEAGNQGDRFFQEPGVEKDLALWDFSGGKVFTLHYDVFHRDVNGIDHKGEITSKEK